MLDDKQPCSDNRSGCTFEVTTDETVISNTAGLTDDKLTHNTVVLADDKLTSDARDMCSACCSSNRGSSDFSVVNRNILSALRSSLASQRCRYAVLVAVITSATLAAVVIVPVVNEKDPIHKKYLNHIVSVMSIKEQKLLILRHRQACYKLSKQRLPEHANVTEDSPVCPVIWDDMVCWGLARAGTVARKACPSYINGFNKHAYVTKVCTEDGSWWINPSTNNTWTNYTECVRPSIDLSFHAAQGDKLRLLYTIGYSFSLGSLLVALIIMLCCKRLHSKSNSLHINLFLAFIFRASISFLKDILFVENVGLAKDVRQGVGGSLEFVQDITHWECKLIMSIFMYSVNACNMCIFAEALYLTMLVSRPLVTERGGVRIYIILGWSLPLVFIIPWILMKALYEDTFCWNIQSNPDYYWILRGSGVGVVVINFFLLLNICRKLFLKLRHSSHLGAFGNAKYRKLAKFILVLIPLFGIMYIVFYVAMPSNFEETEFNVTYLYLEMGYNSFQGFLLALLFCFLNEEVHGELKRIWRRHRHHRLTMSAMKSNYFNSSNNRMKHSTLRTGSQCSNRPATSEQCSQVPHRPLKPSKALSVSYESVSEMSTLKPKADNFKKRRISSIEKGATFQTACTVNKVALSLFPNVKQPDSLLKQVMRTNAHRTLLGNIATETVASVPST